MPPVKLRSMMVYSDCDTALLEIWGKLEMLISPPVFANDKLARGVQLSTRSNRKRTSARRISSAVKWKMTSIYRIGVRERTAVPE